MFTKVHLAVFIIALHTLVSSLQVSLADWFCVSVPIPTVRRYWVPLSPRAVWRPSTGSDSSAWAGSFWGTPSLSSWDLRVSCYYCFRTMLILLSFLIVALLSLLSFLSSLFLLLSMQFDWSLLLLLYFQVVLSLLLLLFIS